MNPQNKKPLKTGRYDDISLNDYHNKFGGISKSNLDKINQSVAHYLQSLEDEEAKSKALVFGSAIHCKILTPDLFEKEFAVLPDTIDRRTKKGKEDYAEFLNNSVGKHIIKMDDYIKISVMEKVLRDHPIAPTILSQGDAEHTFSWVDKKTCLNCKCRPDYLRVVGDMAIDYKTTEDAGYFSFQRSIVNYRYHTQAAFFLDGISQVIGKRIEKFVIIAQEKTAPYLIAIYMLDKAAINTGRIAYQNDLQKYKDYLDSNSKWAGYPSGVQDMMLPVWAE